LRAWPARAPTAVGELQCLATIAQEAD